MTYVLQRIYSRIYEITRFNLLPIKNLIIIDSDVKITLEYISNRRNNRKKKINNPFRSRFCSLLVTINIKSIPGGEEYDENV
jgi:hypothetical protein